MKSDIRHIQTDNKIKTFRWLFYMSLSPILVLFLVPALMVPIRFLLHLEILAALTVGVLFAFYFLGVNIYGLTVDIQRKRLYLGLSIFMSVWILWAVISWMFIEHMDYLL